MGGWVGRWVSGQVGEWIGWTPVWVRGWASKRVSE